MDQRRLTARGPVQLAKEALGAHIEIHEKQLDTETTLLELNESTSTFVSPEYNRER